MSIDYVMHYKYSSLKGEWEGCSLPGLTKFSFHIHQARLLYASSLSILDPSNSRLDYVLALFTTLISASLPLRI